MKNIPNRLKEFRIKNNLKQIEVAEKLGFHSSDRISHWEKGRAVPHLVNLFKISVLYRVLPHELYPELLK